MPRKRKPKPSTEAQREYMAEHCTSFNKQCVRCATIYIKFHIDCPECGYHEWMLEGEVVDAEEAAERARRRGAKDKYRPSESEVRRMRTVIQREWERSKDVRSRQGPTPWEVRRSEFKEDLHEDWWRWA
jgi:predicted  nucleic acid-binding Zn-ribbon protein